MSHAMSLSAALEALRQVRLTGRYSCTYSQARTSWGGEPWFNDERAAEQFEADLEQLRLTPTGERTFTRHGNNLTISVGVQ
jgi:hypothetical protein